tara:strand:+ start:2607 stop:2807 length:201 start_codon:yes stop_codon:yes gene_type:complete
VYKLAISPYLVNSVCIYTPTCSKYAEEAIETKGVFRGVILSLKRLARCNPKNAMAYDPVPQENKLR